MKTSSCKAKGRRLQQKIAKLLLATFPNLTDRDIQSTAMGQNGTDIKLSSEAFKLFPWAVEAKAQEVHSAFISHWEQTTANTKKDEKPMMIITANHKPILAIIKYEDLLGLYKS